MIHYGLEYAEKYDINKVAMEYLQLFNTIKKNIMK
jgi:hypothetical protein